MLTLDFHASLLETVTPVIGVGMSELMTRIHCMGFRTIAAEKKRVRMTIANHSPSSQLQCHGGITYTGFCVESNKEHG